MLTRDARDGQSQRADWKRWTDSDGIPQLPVFSVARAASGVWVGARGGLAHIVPDGETRRAFDGMTVYRALEVEGVLWVAAERGLWRIDGAVLDNLPGALLNTRV